MQHFSSYKRPLYVTGTFCILVASMAFLGYLTQNELLVRVAPTFSCMRFNTALGFVSLGFGLIALGYGKYRWMIIAATIVPIVLGAGILTEYAFGVEIVKHLFIYQPSAFMGCAPDRMAPNTGICFLISGSSLLLMTISKKAIRPIPWILALFGATLLGFSLVVTIAYLGRLEPGYGMLNLTGMGLQTSVGFVSIGILLLLLAYRREFLARTTLPFWFPIPAGLAVLTTVCILCQALAQNQHRHIERFVNSELSGVKNEIVARMEARTFSLIRLARSLQSRNKFADADWKSEALLLMQHFPGISFIEWTDHGFVDRKRVVAGTARCRTDAHNVDILNAERQAIATMRQEHREVLVAPIPKIEGMFMEVVAGADPPLESNFLVATYRSDVLFSDILNPSISPGFAIELFGNAKPVFSRYPNRRKHHDAWLKEMPVIYDGIRWTLKVWPTSEVMEDLQSPIVTITLLAGGALTLLVMTTVFFARKSKLRAVQAEAYSERLVEEIQQRQTAESELRKTHADLENRVAERTLDLQLANRNLNEEMEERIKIEDELDLRAKELARSNAELEQFAYVASHDLQEPLRMITSFVTLLSRNYKGKLDDSADEFIKYVVDGATRMKNLIDDLLSYSRVSGSQRAMTPIGLEFILNDVRSNLKLTIHENDALIYCDSQLPKVEGDRRQVTQLFQNLIANAIKFRGAERPVVRVSAFELTHEWQITIEDNGIGFEMAHADRIFLIFQRLHPVSKYAGSGIGLAICKRIVEIHGGRIWVSSQPNRGTSFSFTLPKMKKLELRAVRETEPPSVSL